MKPMNRTTRDTEKEMRSEESKPFCSKAFDLVKVNFSNKIDFPPLRTAYFGID
jgi:hypothetical protein